MKKILPLVLFVVLLLATQSAFASTTIVPTETEYLPDGSCFVTVIEDVHSSGTHPLSSKTVTKSKTAYYKNSAGKVMWWVKVTGTFTYGN